MANHPYNNQTPQDEPIEIRLGFTGQRRQLILTAWVSDGLVRSSLNDGKGSYGESLSNLQPTEPMPSKATPGWQAEVIRFVESSLAHIMEIR